MQDNSGNFVRDCVKNPYGPIDGAGVGPRWLDLPLLIGALVTALMINPSMFLLCCLVPFTAGVELSFGAGMRAAFCTESHSWVQMIIDWCPVHELMWAVAISSVLTF